MSIPFPSENLREEEKELLIPMSRHAVPACQQAPPREIQADSEKPDEESKPLISKEPNSADRSEPFVLESYTNSVVSDSISPRLMDASSPRILAEHSAQTMLYA